MVNYFSLSASRALSRQLKPFIGKEVMVNVNVMVYVKDIEGRDRLELFEYPSVAIYPNMSFKDILNNINNYLVCNTDHIGYHRTRLSASTRSVEKTIYGIRTATSWDGREVKPEPSRRRKHEPAFNMEALRATNAYFNNLGTRQSAVRFMDMPFEPIDLGFAESDVLTTQSLSELMALTGRWGEHSDN